MGFLTITIWTLGFIILGIIILGIRINKQWERSIVLRLGKFNRERVAGLYFIIPIIESIMKTDMRLIVMDIKKQEVITKDNISVHIDTVVFYRVVNIRKALMHVEDYESNVRQQSLAVMRDIVGENELDELLSHKEKIADQIKKNVDIKAEEWGVDVDQVKLQDIELPMDMKRVMARQAEAAREGKAVVIKASAEKEASTKLKDAAQILAKSPGALQLRMMSTISDVSQDQSNTIVFALPMEVMKGKGAELAAASMSKLASTFPAEKKAMRKHGKR